MIVDVLTTFPDMFEGPMGTSIIGRARTSGALELRTHDLRDWTHDRHRTTDDEIYGGGAGLLMKCEPIFEALDDLGAGPADEVVLFSPAGTPFSQAMAEELSQKPRIIFVCGHYEGVDERVYSRATRVVSLGDYVLTGGELAAMVVTDAVTRLLPGVLGNDMSAVEESFSSGLLEHPQYTRPAEYRGMRVPSILLSGDHAKIDAWRRDRAVERTLALRPDLLEGEQVAAPAPDEEFTDYTVEVLKGGAHGSA